MHARTAPLLALALALGGGAQAQQVALSGLSGNRALLVIDGAAPRFLSPGQSQGTVRLISVGGETAVIEVQGQRQTLRVGDAPVSLGAAPQTQGSANVVLTADGRGHFLPAGQINGRSVQFLVDTGATQVVMAEAEAKRIGLNYEKGQRLRVSTANGAVAGYGVQLDSVRVGEAVVYGVPAVVLPQPMPYVLLGNSFLSRFQMKRQNDQLTLERRY